MYFLLNSAINLLKEVSPKFSEEELIKFNNLLERVDEKTEEEFDNFNYD